MEGSPQPEPDDDRKALIHRQLVAEGSLTESAMTTVALEALEREDYEFFLEVTNTLRQSGDPDVLERTSALLNTYADLAAGITRPEPPTEA